MAYETIDTFVAGNKLYAAELNKIKTNLDIRKDLPRHIIKDTTAYTLAGSPSALTKIHASNLDLAITTNGGDVLVTFTGTAHSGGTETMELHLYVDGVSYITQYKKFYYIDPDDIISCIYPISGLSAGLHTFEWYWLVNGTITFSNRTTDGIITGVMEL